MKLNLRFTIFAAFIWIIAVTSVLSQNKPLQLDFPDIDGWEKSDIVKYPVPELGYSINYESEEGGRVTVYVYNGGRKIVPNDAKDKIIKDEVSKAKKEIYMVQEMGRYKNVKEIKEEVKILGGEKGKIECLHSLLSFTAGRDDLTSEIYMFGYQNHFIKLRATRLFEKEGTKNKSVTDLLSALDKFFATGENVAIQTF